jgi:hypothetical protein
MRASRLLLMCLVLTAAPLVARTPAQQPTGSVARLTSPAAPGSAQPQLTVSSRGVLLSWIERAGQRATLKFSEKTSSGWTPATSVASGDDWFVNWADVPSVLRLSDGTLAAHWLQKNGGGAESYDVRLSYSRDDGKTWARAFLPHDDGTKTQHGFVSLVEMPKSTLGLIWLDGRLSMGGHDAPGGHGGGAMTLRFGAFDRQWTQTADALVDDRVCDCCPTAAAMTSDGLIAAFRNRSETEIRDIHVSRLVNGAWTASAPVHADNWQIDGCPVNGPAIDARGRDVVVSWFTTHGAETQSLAAFYKVAGRTFGTPVRLDRAGSLGRVDVAMLPDGDAIAAWIERLEERAEFRIRRVTPAGTLSPALTIAAISPARSSGYPRMALHGVEMVYAWVESANGVTSVKTAAGAIPPR